MEVTNVTREPKDSTRGMRPFYTFYPTDDEEMKHNKPIAVCQLLPEVLSQMQAMSIKRLDG